jgi:hypothetical protein
MNLSIKITRVYLIVVGIYSQKEGGEKESTEFYTVLQRHINTINKNDYLVMGGDFSA